MCYLCRDIDIGSRRIHKGPVNIVAHGSVLNITGIQAVYPPGQREIFENDLIRRIRDRRSVFDKIGLAYGFNRASSDGLKRCFSGSSRRNSGGIFGLHLFVMDILGQESERWPCKNLNGRPMNR